MLLIVRPAVRCAGPEQDTKLLISVSSFFNLKLHLTGRFPHDRPFLYPYRNPYFLPLSFLRASLPPSKFDVYSCEVRGKPASSSLPEAKRPSKSFLTCLASGCRVLPEISFFNFHRSIQHFKLKSARGVKFQEYFLLDWEIT
jgi:hypothetical protein